MQLWKDDVLYSSNLMWPISVSLRLRATQLRSKKYRCGAEQFEIWFEPQTSPPIPEKSSLLNQQGNDNITKIINFL